MFSLIPFSYGHPSATNCPLFLLFCNYYKFRRIPRIIFTISTHHTYIYFYAPIRGHHVKPASPSAAPWPSSALDQRRLSLALCRQGLSSAHHQVRKGHFTIRPDHAVSSSIFSLLIWKCVTSVPRVENVTVVILYLMLNSCIIQFLHFWQKIVIFREFGNFCIERDTTCRCSWYHEDGTRGRVALGVGGSLAAGSGRARVVEGQLYLTGVTTEDSGHYLCVANNSAGTDSYRWVRVLVNTVTTGLLQLFPAWQSWQGDSK